MPARTQLEFLKLVVRNLPPDLSAEDFRTACEEDFGDRITWSCFNQGKSRWAAQPSPLLAAFLDHL